MYSLKSLASDGLPPLLANIQSYEEWSLKKETILQTWLDCIGGLTPLVKPRMEIVSWKIHDDHFLIRIRYSTVFDDVVPANLLIPIRENNRFETEEDVAQLLYGREEGKPFPAVLALHPTSEAGKDEVCLPTGRENRQYGLELVKRGFVVLAPDTITAGERIAPGEKPFHTASFYERHPDWSAVAKMMVDHRQGISLLESLKLVDSERIGAIGHSLGGYNAYFLAGVDSRLKAVVCSCGFSPFAGDPELHRWGRREWFSHIPKLSDYLDEDMVPFEFHEIAALADFVPVFFWTGQNDTIFPHWKPAAEGLAELGSLYRWHCEEAKFTSLIGNGGHDFPPAIRGMAYTFLEHWLSAEED
ncbi:MULTISPECIES: alpha/beta fold hydrolase [unclassified Mesobacillus]|uniref:alpha/beta hydrolase family protein n=1 Tax=unclassified Mesobacillus TaxID=2675270 RepID=UPI00203C4358|nr:MULTISPECIES: alpha/beta fold hydrolase [unclassified Mesobacillus]MCM3123841.1 dienelactone hydrolase family protein [Mesobacillus sp. MER 33]MCM3234144.1 dienelactone hydrolase family protein [Mesobacillus sp. MER 48]